MKMEKITLTVIVEVLDIHSAPALINEAVQSIHNDVINGDLNKTDGDRVYWETNKENVVI